MNFLETEVSESTADILIAKDKKRITEAEDRSKAAPYVARKAKNLKLANIQIKILFTEGETYKSGDFSYEKQFICGEIQRLV